MGTCAIITYQYKQLIYCTSCHGTATMLFLSLTVANCVTDPSVNFQAFSCIGQQFFSAQSTSPVVVLQHKNNDIIIICTRR